MIRDLDLKIILREIEIQIEKIIKTLIEYDPKYFVSVFCDHEWEQIKFQQGFERKTITSGQVEKKPYYYQCKKCGLYKLEIKKWKKK